MAKITKGNTPAFMLPALDAISSAPAAELPQTRGGRAGGLSTDETAFATAIAAAWGTDGANAAVGPKMDDKPSAQRAAAAIKRLVRSAKVVPAGKVVATRVIAKDSGFSWALSLTDPKPAKVATETPETVDTTPTE